MTIHRLTQDTIGKIAAGEVIERPAAVVKELVENALDADATRIDVSITDGGITEILVRDNGIGIPFEDLPLAVERHATSKISSASDLDSLATLGFRGEALASLAAVSRLQIRSVADGSSSGGLLEVRHGAVLAPQAIAWGGGTSISARNLFENLPARKKFLRQASTEAGYVSRMVAAYAIAYPTVAMSLTVDGKQSFATDGSGDRLNSVVAVWGTTIGRAAIDLEAPQDLPDGYSVEGVITLPEVDRANRQHQHLFVQGRLINSRTLTTAFEQAYHTLIMVGRRPLGCLLITVPPGEVDVNVHPTKSEVRFSHERLVFSMVQRSTRDTLLAHTGRQEVPTVYSSPLAEQPYASSVQRRLSLARPEMTAPTSRPDLAPSPDLPVPAGNVRSNSVPVLRVLGQVANAFVIAEGPDGMYMIDQHAAHERIMFERLMAQFDSRSPDAQTLLSPATLELDDELFDMYRSCRDELGGFGFDIEEFGTNTLLIRAVPAGLKIRDAAEAVRTILAELVDGGRGTSRLESLAISAACHSSIRAGQALSLLEMRELVVQLEQCASPRACGHGRPTMIKMTSEELERQFQRR